MLCGSKVNRRVSIVRERGSYIIMAPGSKFVCRKTHWVRYSVLFLNADDNSTAVAQVCHAEASASYLGEKDRIVPSSRPFELQHSRFVTQCD